MLRILETKWSNTGSRKSRLQFEIERGPVGIGDRYLLIDGNRAYELGNTCQTCSLLFRRLPGATKSAQIENTGEALRKGIVSLHEEVVTTIGLELPEDEYLISLAEATVSPVLPGDKHDYFAVEQIASWGVDGFWCLPHNPRIPYYRAGDKNLGQGRKLFHFIVPMFPTKWLTFTTVSRYLDQIRLKGSGTALCVSVLDIRGPADWPDDVEPEFSEHWCFTHYLVDGHHKLQAAVESNRPLSILSFTASSVGVSQREEIEQAVRSMVE
jgi:hypothetical protein